jgi:hypothetical protein
LRLAKIVHSADVSEDIDKDPLRGWKPWQAVLACVSLKIAKTWRISLICMMRYTPGAGWM